MLSILLYLGYSISSCYLEHIKYLSVSSQYPSIFQLLPSILNLPSCLVDVTPYGCGGVIPLSSHIFLIYVQFLKMAQLHLCNLIYDAGMVQYSSSF